MKDILSYYYFTGETIDGDEIHFETFEPVTEKFAKEWAEKELKCLSGGHIDAWYAETDDFAFDVEV